jgi:hypothetical protein
MVFDGAGGEFRERRWRWFGGMGLEEMEHHEKKLMVNGGVCG